MTCLAQLLGFGTAGREFDSHPWSKYINSPHSSLNRLGSTSSRDAHYDDAGNRLHVLGHYHHPGALRPWHQRRHLQLPHQHLLSGVAGRGGHLHPEDVHRTLFPGGEFNSLFILSCVIKNNF